MNQETLPSSMQALVWEGPHLMNLREVSLPEIRADEVLIKVGFVGICGSELSGYLGHNALRVPPLVMGHEFSGRIAALGEHVPKAAPDLAIGQLVTANPMVYCGKCDYCLEGRTQLCINRRLIGAHRPGAMADYVSAPARMVEKLPEDLGEREGALAEPAACAMRIADCAGDVEGRNVLIMGAGTIGLLTLQVLMLRGVDRVFIADTDPNRRAAAAELCGDVVDPGAVDVAKTVSETCPISVAVDAVGKAVTRAQCIRAVRAGGRVVLSGLHEESSAIPVAEVIRREITLVGSFCYTAHEFRIAVGLLGQGLLSLGPWIVETPLSEGQVWFERLCADNPGRIAKVLLTPSSWS